MAKIGQGSEKASDTREDSPDRPNAGAHPWYALDHAALIYPPLLSDRVSAYYRIQATLDEEVDAELLQRALDALRPRFPYFQVELREGFFWYFFERNGAPNRVVQDSKFPMQKLPTKRRGGYLYRVRAFDKRIALEMCHILTDGYGAFVFFRSLLAEYYRLQGIPTAYGPDVFDPTGTPESSEWEDAFSRLCDSRHSRTRARAIGLASSGLEPAPPYDAGHDRHGLAGRLPRQGQGIRRDADGITSPPSSSRRSRTSRTRKSAAAAGGGAVSYGSKCPSTCGGSSPRRRCATSASSRCPT